MSILSLQSPPFFAVPPRASADSDSELYSVVMVDIAIALSINDNQRRLWTTHGGPNWLSRGCRIGIVKPSGARVRGARAGHRRGGFDARCHTPAPMDAAQPDVTLWVTVSFAAQKIPVRLSADASRQALYEAKRRGRNCVVVRPLRQSDSEGTSMGKRIATMPSLLLTVSMSLSGAAQAQQSLRVDLQLEPPHLDPRARLATTAETVHRNVFQGLTRIDRHGDVQPGLAEHWNVSEDGLRLSLAATQGMLPRWNRFDAEVAAYSLQRLLSERQAILSGCSIGPYVRWRSPAPTKSCSISSQPNSLLPFRLGFSAAVMVHPDSVHTNVTRRGPGPTCSRVGAWLGVAWRPSPVTGAGHRPSSTPPSPTPAIVWSWKAVPPKG
ncbi:hypothetical protein DSL92_04880 [Billgrantia gudaonensis]|uniref:Uncharacterized protein n=1 Tax=Billgrantia gudaonensis TaxID=376427 RepID=A0A3S0R537_9GAMM|nr:hypothetical protein DSL92_04880 [Halomonas gudaonensis]